MFVRVLQFYDARRKKKIINRILQISHNFRNVYLKFTINHMILFNYVFV